MFQNAPSTEKTLIIHYRKITTIVAIKERIVRIKGDKKRAVNINFRWQRAPRIRLLWVPRRNYTSSFDWKCKFARLAQGVARGPLWRGARLEAIGLVGFGLALDLVLYFIAQNLCIICKFIKIDHAEAWKMSYQQTSGFFQELKTTPLAEYFRAINLKLNELFYCSVPAMKWKYRHGQHDTNKQRGRENDQELNLETLVRSVDCWTLVQIFTQRFT